MVYLFFIVAFDFTTNPFKQVKKLFLKIIDFYINPYYNSICRQDDEEKTKKY